MEKYEKVGVVGRGASGTVYLYKRKENGELVIIKQMPVEEMSKDERLSALNEGRVLSMLQHPNIIEYYDSFLQDEAIMIVMEYAPGGTLHDFIQQQNGHLFDEQVIINLLVQILLSLQHVHCRQILHRDLKTQNILLDREKKRVKIGDFGISKILMSKSKALTVVGTPSYISPELCEGKAYNQKSDIWALGCILYELITLKKAFEANTLPALILKILSGNFSPIPVTNCSRELKDLVTSLLHLDPNKRPNVCQIMAQPILMNALADFYTDYAMIPLNTKKQLEVRTFKQQYCDDKRIDVINKSNSIFFWGGRTSSVISLENLSSNKIVSISVSSMQKLGVTESGRVIRWEESIDVPRYLEGLNAVKIVQVVCQDLFTICLTDRGIVLSYGNGVGGCLGHGDDYDIEKPKIVESLLGFEIVRVSCGPSHVIAISQDHEIFSWGCADDGRLGFRSNEYFIARPQRVRIGKNQKLKDIFCGRDCSVLLDQDGKLWTCGSNKFNKLWLGNDQNVSYTYQMLQNEPWNGESVTRVALGVNHSAVITSKGNLFMSGSNKNGQIEVFLDLVENVACGDAFTVVSCSDGRIVCWGKHNGGRVCCGNSSDECKEKYHQIYLPVKYPFKVKDLKCSHTNTMILIEKNE